MVGEVQLHASLSFGWQIDRTLMQYSSLASFQLGQQQQRTSSVASTGSISASKLGKAFCYQLSCSSSNVATSKYSVSWSRRATGSTTAACLLACLLACLAASNLAYACGITTCTILTDELDFPPKHGT